MHRYCVCILLLIQAYELGRVAIQQEELQMAAIEKEHKSELVFPLDHSFYRQEIGGETVGIDDSCSSQGVLM